MTTTDVSIIIVNWSTKDLLKDCLQSIYMNTKSICFEVIVVDNNSTDGSVNLIEREFKKTILIKNKRNLGFAKVVDGRDKLSQKWSFKSEPLRWSSWERML